MKTVLIKNKKTAIFFNGINQHIQIREYNNQFELIIIDGINHLILYTDDTEEIPTIIKDYIIDVWENTIPNMYSTMDLDIIVKNLTFSN